MMVSGPPPTAGLLYIRPPPSSQQSTPTSTMWIGPRLDLWLLYLLVFCVSGAIALHPRVQVSQVVFKKTTQFNNFNYRKGLARRERTIRSLRALVGSGEGYIMLP